MKNYATLNRDQFENIACDVLNKEFDASDLESTIKSTMLASLFIFADAIADEMFGGDD